MNDPVRPHILAGLTPPDWTSYSIGWGQGASDIFEQGADAMSRHLFELGGVRPGQAVLDIATGFGEPALSAVPLVGPEGRVVGVDISEGMIEGARKRARGLDNVEFVVGDVAEGINLPLASFDVALSRFGWMFVSDQVAAFRNVAKLLVPGGRLAVAAWTQPERVPMIALGGFILARHAGLPQQPTGTPWPFSMADRDQVTDWLTQAGFVEISITEFEVPFRMESAQQYVEFAKGLTPAVVRAQIADLGPDGEAKAWAAVAAATEPYQNDKGEVYLPSIAQCLQASTPQVA